MNLQAVITKECNLLEGMTEDEIKCISHHLKVQNFTKNDLLMKKGEPADILMIIINGSTRPLND